MIDRWSLETSSFNMDFTSLQGVGWRDLHTPGRACCFIRMACHPTRRIRMRNGWTMVATEWWWTIAKNVDVQLKLWWLALVPGGIFIGGAERPIGHPKSVTIALRGASIWRGWRVQQLKPLHPNQQGNKCVQGLFWHVRLAFATRWPWAFAANCGSLGLQGLTMGVAPILRWIECETWHREPWTKH